MEKTIAEQREELLITAKIFMERSPMGSNEHKKGYFLNLFAKMSIHDQLNFIYDGIVELGLATKDSEVMDRYNKHQKQTYDFLMEEGESGFGIQTIENVVFYTVYVA